MSTHWGADGRGAACGGTIDGVNERLSPSMSEATCSMCRTLVQMQLDCVAEFASTRSTLPGVGPLPPLPEGTAPGVTHGEIDTDRYERYPIAPTKILPPVVYDMPETVVAEW